MALGGWLALGQAGLSLWQGWNNKNAAEAGGEAAKWASYANAEDLRYYAGLNSGLIMGAAERNAAAYMRIGEANASAIERATARNLDLYGMQADEEVRRHIRGEKMLAGNIRATSSGSGIQVNTGTPLHYLYDQVDEGIAQREFMINKHAQTMWTMSEEGKDKAYVTRLTASENAAVIMSNADAQAQMAILDSERVAASLERQGDVAQQGGAAAGAASMLGGLMGAFGAVAGGFSSGALSMSGIGGGFNSPLATNWRTAGGWSNSVVGTTGSAWQGMNLTDGLTVGGSFDQAFSTNKSSYAAFTI